MNTLRVRQVWPVITKIRNTLRVDRTAKRTTSKNWGFGRLRIGRCILVWGKKCIENHLSLFHYEFYGFRLSDPKAYVGIGRQP
eukprot:scaffold2955_cov203-Chaetoceros_neogracile.AAC.4